MPKGVAERFLLILRDDQRTHKLRTLVLAGVALALAPAAYFLAPPWGLLIHLAALIVAVAAGTLLGLRAVRGYEASVRGGWEAWMAAAGTADSVSHIHRTIQGRPIRSHAALLTGSLTALWALEVLLLIFAFQTEERRLLLSLPVLLANATLVGILTGHLATLWRWCAGFESSLSDMVASGELGLWGVR